MSPQFITAWAQELFLRQKIGDVRHATSCKRMFWSAISCVGDETRTEHWPINSRALHNVILFLNIVKFG